MYYFAYLLAPWRRVFLEKLTSSQLVKKFPKFLETKVSLQHSQVPATWAHTSGSIQVWGTSLYFITWNILMMMSCSKLTQPLSWSTTPCRLSVTAYSVYSQLPSILETIPPSSTWGLGHAVLEGTDVSWLHCLLWWIYYNKWLRRCIVSMHNKHYCFLSSWYVSFLGSSGKVKYHASHLPLQILCFKSNTVAFTVKSYV